MKQSLGALLNSALLLFRKGKCDSGIVRTYRPCLLFHRLGLEGSTKRWSRRRLVFGFSSKLKIWDFFCAYKPSLGRPFAFRSKFPVSWPLVVRSIMHHVFFLQDTAPNVSPANHSPGGDDGCKARNGFAKHRYFDFIFISRWKETAIKSFSVRKTIKSSE